MFYVCVQRFDVTENFEKFLVLGELDLNKKLFKILCHIESYDTCMEY